MIRSLTGKMEAWLNHFKLQRKLLFFYIGCMFLPLIITDSIILYGLIRGEQVEKHYKLAREAENAANIISGSVDYAAAIANRLYANRYLYEYLNTVYVSPLDYMEAYRTFQRNTMNLINGGIAGLTVNIYAENDSILNGGVFHPLAPQKEEDWYRALVKSGRESLLYFSYTNLNAPYFQPGRSIFYIRKMDLMPYDAVEKLIVIELRYGSIADKLKKIASEDQIYLYEGETLLMSNTGHNNTSLEFERPETVEKADFTRDFDYYGCSARILVKSRKEGVLIFLRRHLSMVLILVLINLVLPWIFMRIMHRSLVHRIRVLETAFANSGKEKIEPIGTVKGRDEITALMQGYNKMALRINELIETVYKERLKSQETAIARKNAELLALRSQIDPHFMFNTLESIRMHSLLKEETETADMVAKLALMERQIISWKDDLVEIGQELEVAGAYLGLQKYRFGDRLSYRITAEPDCMKVRIPRLSIVTFVENACIHGLERKVAGGWIFVRIGREGDKISLEVEDTGESMSEEQLRQLREEIGSLEFDHLRREHSIGIINACLRLKMVFGADVEFELSGEEGVGTVFCVKIPAAQAQGADGHDAPLQEIENESSKKG